MKCNDDLLMKLLDEVPSSSEKEEAANSHLASCSRCQARIEQLAADHDSWIQVISALEKDDADQRLADRGSVVIAIDTELADDIPLQVDSVSLDFLDSPSHPEMLGRIGRYEVERLIGAGGMGIVLKAFDTELHRPVAVKVLAPHLAHNGGARQRFAREAQSAAAVVHDNVVPIHNVDAAGKLPFLVMQYVAGDSLQGRVDRLGPLSPRETLRIGAQIANGLAAAHEQGLVHRDVKPGNVLMEESIDRVMISDFGLARAADDASVTRSGVIAGTPHYMSPEQARGDSIDSRSDLFGLGSVLYFMCTGHPPFRAQGAMGVLNRICNDTHRPVDEVNEMVPAPLADLIDELLAKSANARPATAHEVAVRLMSLLNDSRSHNRYRRNRNRWRSGFWPSKKLTGLTLSSVLVVALIGFFGQRFLFNTSVPSASSSTTYGSSSSGSQIVASNDDEVAKPEIAKLVVVQPDAVKAERFLGSSSPTVNRDVIDPGTFDSFDGAAPQQVVSLPQHEIVQDEVFDRMLEIAQLQMEALEIESPPNDVELVDPYSGWDDEFEALNREVDEAEYSDPR